MIRCSLQAISRVPAVVDYTFYDESGLKLLETKGDVIQTSIASAFRELPIIPYTLSLIDADGNERFHLERKTPPPFQTHAFQLSFDGEVVDFFEDKARFSLPNLSFIYREKKYDIVGFVRNREFFIEEDELKLMSMTASPIAGGKEYAVAIYEDALPLAVYFAAVIIMDICFHNY